MAKLTLDALNNSSAAEFRAALANVFEHSPWIAEAAAAGRPYPTLAGLRKAMLTVIDNASAEQRLALIRVHPDLANKAQRAEGLTADSTSEQDGAGLDRLSEDEFALFARLNEAYKAKFGIPFIVCVKRHTKDSILDVFERRLGHSVSDEQRAAVTEISRIASLRMAQMIDAPDELPVHGHLSTHVLDTHSGGPAEGVPLQFVELSWRGAERILFTGQTNVDGRTDCPLFHERPVPIGRYELRFMTAEYYRRRGVTLSEPPFLDDIVVRFNIAEPEARYHVPLLMTPWSYSVYRGS